MFDQTGHLVNNYRYFAAIASFCCQAPEDHKDCREVTGYTLEYGLQLANGTIKWTSVALSAGVTSHRAVNLNPGDYVVKLTATNAGNESSFHLTQPVSVKFSSGGAAVVTLCWWLGLLSASSSSWQWALY